MYKVMIVDDEEFVIKSLTGSIPWEALGFEIAGKATNGKEALELISNLQFDVIFSDVRMPGINGLELIKEVQKNNPNIIFIIISGYPEFSYVQKALNYGALGYCLKPFDESEISKLLVKAKSILDSRSIVTNDDFFNFAELLYNPDKKDVLKLKLQSKGLNCDNENGLSVISITSLEHPIIQGLQSYISFKAGMQKYYLIVPSKYATEQSFSSLLNDNKIIMGIGISEPFFSLNKIQEAIEEANLLSYQYFVNGQIICSYTIKDNFKKGDELVNRIIGEYMKGKVSIENMLFEIDKLIESSCINIKHAFKIYNIITCFTNLSDTPSPDNIYGFNELTKLFKDFKGMRKYLEKLPITEKAINVKEGRAINFTQIHNYIDSNFCMDITIQEISEKYYINPSYMSQLFRKEIGVTFTDYVTKKRMEYAKELLRDETKKTVDIAQKCGYNDYFYFIRSFKKYAGISPGQYRNER